MAPAPPVGRAQAIALVEAGRLPVWLGSPHPFVAIVDGKPLGTVHVDAATRAELLETMRSMEWPSAW